MKMSIVKHIESSFIYVSKNFKVEDMPDDDIINMLDDVENRI